MQSEFKIDEYQTRPLYKIVELPKDRVARILARDNETGQYYVLHSSLKDRNDLEMHVLTVDSVTEVEVRRLPLDRDVAVEYVLDDAKGQMMYPAEDFGRVELIYKGRTKQLELLIWNNC